MRTQLHALESGFNKPKYVGSYYHLIMLMTKNSNIKFQMKARF